MDVEKLLREAEQRLKTIYEKLETKEQIDYASNAVPTMLLRRIRLLQEEMPKMRAECEQIVNAKQSLVKTCQETLLRTSHMLTDLCEIVDTDGAADMRQKYDTVESQFNLTVAQSNEQTQFFNRLLLVRDDKANGSNDGNDAENVAPAQTNKKSSANVKTKSKTKKAMPRTPDTLKRDRPVQQQQSVAMPPPPSASKLRQPRPTPLTSRIRSRRQQSNTHHGAASSSASNCATTTMTTTTTTTSDCVSSASSFQPLSVGRFERVSSVIRGRCKLTDLNAVYECLFELLAADGGRTKPVTIQELAKNGVKAGGKTGECILNTLRSLKIVSIQRDGGITLL
jgi:Spindle and kinetochore-associated protein 2/Protein of unknown function (DUF3161)